MYEPVERTHIRKRAGKITGQTQIFLKKKSWDEVFTAHSHLMHNMHNTREKMTQIKSPTLEGGKEIAILGKIKGCNCSVYTE